ncbi:MAG: hypothetical protein Q9166_005306 [cf. Caloplaca sp. 2 TL-2023]
MASSSLHRAARDAIVLLGLPMPTDGFRFLEHESHLILHMHVPKPTKGGDQGVQHTFKNIEHVLNTVRRLLNNENCPADLTDKEIEAEYYRIVAWYSVSPETLLERFTDMMAQKPMEDDFGTMQAELATMQETLANNQRDLEIARRDLAATQGSMTTTDQSLGVTEQELTETKANLAAAQAATTALQAQMANMTVSTASKSKGKPRSNLDVLTFLTSHKKIELKDPSGKKIIVKKTPGTK